MKRRGEGGEREKERGREKGKKDKGRKERCLLLVTVTGITGTHTHTHTHTHGFRPALTKRKTMQAAAAAAKSLQSCLTLCDPIDGSPPDSPVPGILQARTLEWVAISFSNA